MEKNIEDLVDKLTEKYQRTGQDVTSYLEGLLVSDYVPYWDYIHLDTLMTLQKPKTKYKDERIFIMYHQITELYFRLILDECEQIVENIKMRWVFSIYFIFLLFVVLFIVNGGV